MSDRPDGWEPANVWERLRRRKVVQWTLAYAAGAWGLLQGIGFAADAFNWPVATKQVALLILLLGLPIAFVIAWYHGDRGEQHVSRAELSIITLLLFLGGGLLWFYQRTMTSPAPSPSAAASAIAAPDRSIAVLPFVNMSADKEQEYFADGISEELLDLLTKIPDLKVIARTSSFAFKGKDVDIANIAERLHVAHVLEGSVRKSGNKVRITVQLVRAADSTHLWSETYERTLDDVFAIQDEIAAAVVAQLKIKLLGDAPAARPIDARVYPMILQAWALANQGTAEATARAVELYQQALVIAPDEPRAWSGLGGMYFDQGSFLQRPAVEARRMAMDALEKALALDPDDAVTHALLGAVLTDDDLGSAAPHYERALALDPSNVEVLRNVSVYLDALGRLDESLALQEYVVNRDPAGASSHYSLGIRYYYAGRWDESIASSRIALSLSPEYIAAHFDVGQALLFKGEAKAALAEMQAEPDKPSRLQGVALAEYSLGRAAEADAALKAVLADNTQGQATWIAMVYAWRREADRAFEWLDKAAADREAIFWITLEPMFASLHDDPRWLPFLRKIGRAPEQLAAIKFNVKVPR